MIYAQFFQYSTGYVADSTPPRFDGPKTLIEACGDRAVIILDGRKTKFAHECIAKVECKKRGYVAFQIFKGESFTRSSSISPIQPI